jgi:AcrR family transcriptional regulator
VPVTPTTVADVKHNAEIEHVLIATRKFVMAYGLDATMDQIAEASGVSRRTLFRLFGSRDNLIASAFLAGMNFYRDELPRYDGSTDIWLRETCHAAHRMNAASGPGFWELTSRTNLPRSLQEIEQVRRRQFRRMVREIADVLWSSRTGPGEPPGELITSIGAHLSPHFTAAIVTDLGQGWRIAATLAHDAIFAQLQALGDRDCASFSDPI